ncbi:MAG: hypothetical protein J6T26_08145 [Firmicutes bacterium]|nr:hypothetical protein [Bacillota bacterium]
MTKEDKYKAVMESLGTWNVAYAPLVHELCILEREISRARAAWKRTAPPGGSPSPLDPHYTMIRQMVREATALRDTLGLTPRGLRRIKGINTGEGSGEDHRDDENVLTLVRKKYA